MPDIPTYSDDEFVSKVETAMTNQTAPDDLVERLLTQADGSRTPSLLKEAATRIKELKAEVERVTGRWIGAERVCDSIDGQRREAEARATKAEEAVRAFVDRWNSGERADTDYVASLMLEALEGKA